MARARKKREDEAGELNMVAMIDVAMQLLNFFLVTMHPMDVLTNLDVFRPSPDSRPVEQQVKPPNMVRILVAADGYMINDRTVPVTEMDGMIGKLASISRDQTILIMCSTASRHGDLVRVLDLCTKNGLKDLSVVSSN